MQDLEVRIGIMFDLNRVGSGGLVVGVGSSVGSLGPGFVVELCKWSF